MQPQNGLGHRAGRGERHRRDRELVPVEPLAHASAKPARQVERRDALGQNQDIVVAHHRDLAESSETT